MFFIPLLTDSQQIPETPVGNEEEMNLLTEIFFVYSSPFKNTLCSFNSGFLTLDLRV